MIQYFTNSNQVLVYSYLAALGTLGVLYLNDGIRYNWNHCQSPNSISLINTLELVFQYINGVQLALFTRVLCLLRVFLADSYV